MSELSSDAARELSRLGASKGGQARAKALTSAERSEIARRAVEARWAKTGRSVPSESVQDFKIQQVTLHSPPPAPLAPADLSELSPVWLEPSRRGPLKKL